MSEKSAAPAKTGTGLAPAGVVLALLGAAAAFLAFRDDGTVDEAEVTAAVQSAVPAVSAPVEATSGTVASSEVPPGADAEDEAEAAPVDQAATEAAQTEAETGTEDTVATQVPSIDEVRVDDSGLVVVAGRAAPGSRVDVLIDGEVVTSADADASGSFAALGSVAEAETARSLTLRTGEGENATASAEEIILAPVGTASAPRDAESGPSGNADTAQVAALSAPENGQGGNAAPAPQADVAAATGASDLPVAEAAAQQADGPEDPADPQPRAVEPATETADAAETVNPNPTETAVANTPVATEGTPAAAAPVAQAEGASDDVQGGASSDTRTSAADTSAPQQEPSTSAAPDAAPETGRKIAVLRSDTEGVTLVAPEPVSAGRITLDTIGYTDEGVVQLAGRASSEAVEVRAYLDNRAVARLPVAAEGGWRGDVPGVTPGVYTLRLDAMTSDGRVASRLETPFKREAPATLAAAAQTQDSGGPVRAVTVQTGDTLWAIARERYGEGILYVQVFEANRGAIRDPDLIYPGQVFDLPGD